MSAPSPESSQSSAPIPHRGRVIAALLLGLVGFGAAVATLYASPIEGVTDLGCGVRALDCSEVLGSQWGKLAGIPLGVFGAAYFAFWIVSLGAWWRSRDDSFIVLVTWSMTIGVAFSLTLLSLLLFLIDGNCLFCLITHASNLGAAILLLPLRTWQSQPLKPIAIRGALMLLVSLLFALGLMQLYQARVKRAEAKAQQETIW